MAQHLTHVIPGEGVVCTASPRTHPDHDCVMTTPLERGFCICALLLDGRKVMWRSRDAWGCVGSCQRSASFQSRVYSPPLKGCPKGRVGQPGRFVTSSTTSSHTINRKSTINSLLPRGTCTPGSRRWQQWRRYKKGLQPWQSAGQATTRAAWR